MHIETTCNTADDVLFAHIEQNSRLPIPWLKSVPAHDGHAVIVGGAPSVADWIEEIRYRKSIGQSIFALNNAAKFLHDAGIQADYQIIVDARESNGAFIGYAKHHLLASQCHPSLFDKASSVTLWHQEYPDDMERLDSSLPASCPDHALIGGGTTVGLSAMALVYALGYRKLHLYGYDSSSRGEKTHAYDQSDPQSVPCTVTVSGKTFESTLAMARQAELFPQLSDTLIDLGCFITIRGDGLLPWTSKMSSVREELTERQKYEKMWEFPAYRTISPGELVAQTFVEVVKPDPEGRIIDFGCGTGRGTVELAKLTQCELWQVDFATNCRDPGQEFTFIACDMTGELPKFIEGDYAYCTDVLEHIEPGNVDRVIRNVMKACPRAFFQISTVPDHCRKLIGHPLHLTVQPFEWWKEKFRSLGYAVQWERKEDIAALFYVLTT